MIGEMVKKSKILGVPSVVYTFDPPPCSYFEGAAILTPVQEKLQRLSELGVEHVVARFDAAYLSRSPRSFIEELAELNPVEVLVGKDFRFGRNREGRLVIWSSSAGRRHGLLPPRISDFFHPYSPSHRPLRNG